MQNSYLSDPIVSRHSYGPHGETRSYHWRLKSQVLVQSPTCTTSSTKRIETRPGVLYAQASIVLSGEGAGEIRRCSSEIWSYLGGRRFCRGQANRRTAVLKLCAGRCPRNSFRGSPFYRRQVLRLHGRHGILLAGKAPKRESASVKTRPYKLTTTGSTAKEPGSISCLAPFVWPTDTLEEVDEQTHSSGRAC